MNPLSTHRMHNRGPPMHDEERAALAFHSPWILRVFLPVYITTYPRTMLIQETGIEEVEERPRGLIVAHE